MAIMPGVPWRPNVAITQPASSLAPNATVAHRTIGTWAGDLAVLTRERIPSCHFLVGHVPGEWAQMVDTAVRANHAAGANSWAVGIEVSGQNGEVFTEWQALACAAILQWARNTHGVPLVYYDDEANRISSWDGTLSHASVETTPEYKHYDHWLRSDWDRIITKLSPPLPTPGGDMANNNDEGFLAKTKASNTLWFLKYSGRRTAIGKLATVDWLVKYKKVPSAATFVVSEDVLKQYPVEQG